MQQPPSPRTAWTVIFIRSRGRTLLRLAVPLCARTLGRVAFGTAFATAMFAGWLLQGRFGEHDGRAVQVNDDDDLSIRWSRFDEAGNPAGPARGRSALVQAMTLGLGNRPAAVALWAGRIAARWSAAAAEVSGPSDGTLLWPVHNGRHVRGYGSGKNAYHLAVDIAGPLGSDVLAAASGIVGYVGNQMHGYGNLLILVHPGGRATFYAHNQRFLVVAGEHVAKGQRIAVLGSTGRSEGPHVHFELVYNGNNCDPAPLFRMENHRSLASVTPATWTADAPKPRAIRCSHRRSRPRGEEESPAIARALLDRQPLATIAPLGSLNGAL